MDCPDCGCEMKEVESSSINLLIVRLIARALYHCTCCDLTIERHLGFDIEI